MFQYKKYIALCLLLMGPLAAVAAGTDDEVSPATSRPVQEADYAARVAELEALVAQQAQELAEFRTKYNIKPAPEPDGFDRFNTRASKEAGRACVEVAEALDIEPGSDLRKMAAGDLPVLGGDAKKVVKEADRVVQDVKRFFKKW